MVRVHSLDGEILLSKASLNRLLTLINECGDDKIFITLSSPFLSSTFSNTPLTQKQIEKTEKGYLKLFSSLLDGSDYLSEINALFEEVVTFSKFIRTFSSFDKDLLYSFLDGEDAKIVTILVKYFLLQNKKSSIVILSINDLLSYKDLFQIKERIVLSPVVSKRRKGSGRAEEGASLIASHFSLPLTFWNNSSLLYSAPPKTVANAHVIKHLTYREATELSFFGAPILHPREWIKAEECGLEIQIRCFKDKSDECNIIDNKNEDYNGVKALSVLKNVSLINTEGSGMSGVPGISSRIFTSLKNENISVIFISQASSEYSVCFAIKDDDKDKALEALRNEFKKEIEEHLISSIKGESGLSIIAIVGEGMNGKVGIAGSFFSSLSRSGVNVRAIAQGSSERNISAVISSKDTERAERALHTVLFLSRQTLSIGLFGPGNIGGTLLRQIGREKERLKSEFDLDILVRGIANSKRMLLSEKGVDLKCWKDEFEKNSTEYDEEKFLSHVGAEYYPHFVLVDCTSSEEIAGKYSYFLKRGFHVITPNKKAPSSSYSGYENIFKVSKESGKKFYYETTVGAGLPIITTLKDLKETGDKIISIEGLLSGTLSWLFTSFDGSVPFSSLIHKAKDLGYTEPDPRDDLSGMDVARKIVILSRTMGYKSELEDIKIENLVPKELLSLSLNEFLSSCDIMDEKILSLYERAKEKDCTLRYFGKVEKGVCSVGLGMFPSSHPFSRARGTDNVIQFKTERYFTQPLVVQGPGAGPEVTAAGIFGDLLRLSAYLGSRV